MNFFEFIPIIPNLPRAKCKEIEDAFKNINEIQLNEDPFPTAAEWVPILVQL